MRTAIERDIGPDKRPRANRDKSRVQEGAVEVDEHVAADFDVCAVVDGDGTLGPRVCVEDGVFAFLGRW